MEINSTIKNEGLKVPIPSMSIAFLINDDYEQRIKQSVVYQFKKTEELVLKQYQCNICPSRFKRKFDYERHLRMHTNTKPFVCSICQKSFTRKDAVGKHTLTNGFCKGNN